MVYKSEQSGKVEMKLHSEPNRDYQLQAIEAFCGLFYGQETCRMKVIITQASTRGQMSLFAGDNGFTVFKFASSNIWAWEADRDKLAETLEASIEHLKTDRTEQDILFELLLKLGLDLCVPIEQKKIAGKQVHSIGGGTLIVCLNESIVKKEVELLAMGIIAWHKNLTPAGETTVVFRDSAFADDVAKTNLTAILQQHGLEKVRSL